MARILLLLVLLATASGCAWCVDPCLGPPTRPVRAPEKRPPAMDPCDLVPGSLYRAIDRASEEGERAGRPKADQARTDRSSLFFDVDYVEWRHDGLSEIFDWRCRDGWIQIREGRIASDASLRGDRELSWLGKTYVLEQRR